MTEHLGFASFLEYLRQGPERQLSLEDVGGAPGLAPLPDGRLAVTDDPQYSRGLAFARYLPGS